MLQNIYDSIFDAGNLLAIETKNQAAPKVQY